MKVIGCDVSKDFAVLYDGSSHYTYGTFLPRAKELDLEGLKELLKDATVIIEQTGTYGIRYAQIFKRLGATVLVADGKEFKRFRLGRSRNKDDLIDAKYLREFYLSLEHQRYVRPFHQERFTLRALIRHIIRTNKDLTRSVNRLKQSLAYLFPEDSYYNLSRYKLFKELPAIEKALLAHDNILKLTALAELQKIKTCLESLEQATETLKEIVEAHPDYEILKTFPHLNLISIATLIAYYWDINLFKTKDAFIGYVLMGTKLEQSGKSLYSNRTDKARTEVKGNLYMIYLQACRKTSPLKPLTDHIRASYAGSHNNKKRYIKFLDKLLEAVYYALKHRLTFQQLIDLLIRRRIEQREKLLQKRKEKELSQRELSRLYKTSNLLLVYQDISDRLTAAEHQTYNNGEFEEEKGGENEDNHQKPPNSATTRKTNGRGAEPNKGPNGQSSKRATEPNSGAPPERPNPRNKT